MRLAKYIAQQGYCSRRHAEKLIQNGLVKVNGSHADIATSVEPGFDRVEVESRVVGEKKKPVYIMLNKPAGVISTCKAGKEKGPIILDLIKVSERIYPVGRLDRDSTGLLLLTNDGETAYRLAHPGSGCEKEYFVEFDSPLTARQVQLFTGGISLNGKEAVAWRIKRIAGRKYRIVLQQGINRQIRRMAEAVGRRVVKLKRLRMGPLSLGKLPEGAWRRLTPAEIIKLK